MGDWNTLHFFDERKFQKKFVPVLKGNRDELARYFNSKIGQTLIENSDIFQKERIEQVVEIANKIDDNFIYPVFAKELKSVLKFDEKRKIINKYEIELEDFISLIYTIIFTECAPFFPYFRMGKGLSFSAMKYTHKNSKAEYLFNRIRYCPYPGSVFCSDGIRSVMRKEEVEKLLANYSQIQPNLKENSPSHNQFAITFIDKLHDFLTIAVQNKWGLIWCCNPEESVFRNLSPPIGKHLKWDDFKAKNTNYWIWK